MSNRVTYRDKPADAYDHDVVPGFSPVTWGDLRGGTDPSPFQNCVWPLVKCPLRYATVVAGLALCTQHAGEAVAIMLTGEAGK